jgi:putative ABC transport system permease protein
MSPRWKKIVNDLWSSKSRTALVVISIFIGVFATGVISGARSIVVNELQRSYEATRPAQTSIRFSEDDSFGDDLIEVIRKMDGVEDAEGRRLVGVSMQVAPGDWEDLQLTVIPDFDDVRINQFDVVAGEPDPGDKEVLIERSSMAEMDVTIGDSLLVERSDGKQKLLEIVGIIHDISVRPTRMSGAFYGYISRDTAEWLGESRTYTRLLLRIAPDTAAAVPPVPEGGPAARGMGGRGEEQQMMQIVETVNDKIEKSGREPSVPRGPHGGIATEHWATSLIQNLSMMMSVLGVMSLFLSGFLVTNTVSALLAQQVKQIGIMKTVGARGYQIMLMYMVLVVGFGLLAMLLALPLTLGVTKILVTTVANYFNFDLSEAPFPLTVLLLQAFASLGIPVIASVLPVITGTRITIREALSSDGGQGSSRKKKGGQVGRFSLSGLLSHILSRPLILSIRNTFRRKMRVSLTLLTLTVGGLMFIGIFTIRNSLVLTLDQFIEREFNFDAVLVFERSYRDYYVIETALRVPGVVAAEAWSEGIANRVYESGWQSEDITLNALPPDS